MDWDKAAASEHLQCLEVISLSCSFFCSPLINPFESLVSAVSAVGVELLNGFSE